MQYKTVNFPLSLSEMTNLSLLKYKIRKPHKHPTVITLHNTPKSCEAMMETDKVTETKDSMKLIWDWEFDETLNQPLLFRI